MNDTVLMVIGIGIAAALIGTTAATAYGFLAALRDPAAATADVSTGRWAQTRRALDLHLTSRLHAAGALVGILSWLLVVRIVGPTGSTWMAVVWWLCAAVLVVLCLLGIRLAPRLPIDSGARTAESIRLGFSIVVTIGLFAVAVLIAAR